MSLKRSTVIVLLAALVLQGAPVSGAPSLTIQSPTNNALSATSEVDVKGTAAGTQLSWNETSAEDFGRGSFCSTVGNANGTVSLGNGLYDDFNDNSMDEYKWSITTHVMMNISEEDGALRFTTSGYPAPNGLARATATGRAGDRLDADLDFKSPLNVASLSHVGFDIDLDANNYIHLIYGCLGGEPTIQAYCVKGGGSPSGEYAKFESNKNHISVVFSLNRVSINASDAMWLVLPMDYRTATVSLYGYAYYQDKVDAAWDNVCLGKALQGTFTSAVKDTGASISHLKSCGWTSQTPPGTDVRLQYRSSASPSMANSSDWANLVPGNIGGTVTAARYFQYRARLSTNDPQVTPYLYNVSFTHYIPIEKVELSADGGKSWTVADGEDSWTARLALPEGRFTLLVRAVDTAGAKTSATLNVTVDLTKPTGSVVINGGSETAESTEVVLTLDAIDTNGVSGMRLSEDSYLGGTEWMPFSRELDFSLSPGEGNKTVYAQFRDKAGWMSEIVSDSIFLDFTPPVGTVAINGGAAYTNSPAVELNLTAYDLQGVASMQLSNEPGFASAGWQDFKGRMQWNLLPGDGEKAVFARFRTETLQTSEAVSDKIILDSTPPAANVSINEGNPMTTSRDVQVSLSATDNNNVARMQISENSTFSDADVKPFVSDFRFTLSPGDGEKGLFVRVWDDAGNVFTANRTRIILDTAPPVVRVAPLPASQDTLSISLSWEGSDLTTGVASYDVQYRNGTDWSSLLTGFHQNSTKFTGKEGSSYFFRIRATDAAGNTCPFVEAGPVAIVKPDLSPPEVAITAPAAGMTVKGQFAAGGTSRHPVAGRTVEKVQVRLDDGAWADANGTASWSFSINTKSLPDGKHSLRARAYDGRTYSSLAEVNFTVNNAVGSAGGTVDNTFILSGVALVIIAAGAIAAIMLVRKRIAKGL